MKQVNLQVHVNAGSKASIEYTTITRATVPNNGGVVFSTSTIKCRATVPNNGGVVFLIYGEDTIKGNIVLKIHNTSERLLLKKEYTAKAFMKLSNAAVAINKDKTITAKFGPGSKGVSN